MGKKLHLSYSYTHLSCVLLVNEYYNILNFHR